MRIPLEGDVFLPMIKTIAETHASRRVCKDCLRDLYGLLQTSKVLSQLADVKLILS